ncbi:MAG: trigger factor [Candidatus Nanopelagicales bacterium]
MKSSKETVSPTRVNLSIELDPADLKPALETAYRQIAQQVNIPGFRKGKVPAKLLEQRFGRGVVLQEALQEAVPRAITDALVEHEVDALGTPNVVIDQDLAEVGDQDSIAFVAEVDVRPEIDLPDYRGMAVEVADAEVSDDDVDAQLTELRGRFAKVTPVERAVADGDVVVVDVKGAADDEEVEEYSGAGMSFEVGAGNMIPGFDDAVRGASEGDVVEFGHVPTEGDYADREILLSVTVKGVRERELPEPDDDFAMMASEFDTIDELRDDLRTRLERSRLVDQGIEARDKLAKALLDGLEIPVPEQLLAQLVDQHFSDGHGDDAHREEFIDETKQTLRSQFLLDAIAEAEDVDVAQDDISAWIMQQAPRYGMSPDQFVQALLQADQLNSAIGDVRRAKALSVVLEAAQITDASGRPVDLKALDEDEDELVDEAELEDEDELDELADEAELAADADEAKGPAGA